MSKSQILISLKKCKSDIEIRFGIKKIGLFGSYSVNKANQRSDIDIVYELKEGRTLGFKEIYELEKYFQEILHTGKIDLVNRKYMNPLIEDEMTKTVIYV